MFFYAHYLPVYKKHETEITQTNCNMEIKNVNSEVSNAEMVQKESENVQIQSESVQITTENVQKPTEIVLEDTEKVVIPTEKVLQATKKVKSTEKKAKTLEVKKAIVKEIKPLPTTTETKEPTRKGITAMFSIDEMEHLDPIIQNRINAGISANASHFVRQCIDYAINAEYFLNKNVEVRFATHDEKKPFQYKLLKDALFANKNTNIEVCK